MLPFFDANMMLTHQLSFMLCPLTVLFPSGILEIVTIYTRHLKKLLILFLSDSSIMMK